MLGCIPIVTAMNQVCCAGAFMSPDGQKALIAGGTTAFSCKHFSLAERSPRDARVIALPDLFELDLSTACWVPVSS